MKNFHLYLIVSTFILASCGGGGGGGGGSTPTTPTTPAPTVNLSADPTSVLLERTSTLTWSSSNASSCSADWTSQTSTSGSEAVTISTAGDNSFSISCTGDGGSRSASVTVEGYRNTEGVVVDGYISGAEVCIDENDNWICDSTESSTTSDNDGKFTIKYANGNLVSIGGTDLDSQTLLDNLLITHKLTGHSEFKAVTPVTSIAAFMEDASLVNAALGVDSSIDVFTFDPVANKGDGGINDYLYEKGNQLTVLAFALQNITNNLNTTTETTQDYFKAITEEIEKEYTETQTKVDIETEAFVTKVFDNVITAKSVTIDETAKANTTKALAGVIPVIEVKSSDELTTAVIRFAISTLQTDIQAIADGSATEEIVTSYTSDILTYIAEDQNIDADKITPNISAIADSATTSEDTAVEINILLNDSYVTTAPVTVTTSNGTNGTTTITDSSSEQITYDPDPDYNGTDTFSYTITQGDKTSSADVTVTIEPVNDAPTINIASTIKVDENQTAVTTVSVSDVDEDELTLTLGGTDSDSFNLSDDNVLTFKEAPDYETKTSYSISLNLTDGEFAENKTIDILVNDVQEVFILNDNFTNDEDTISLIDVLANDSYVGSTFNLSVEDAINGELTVVSSEGKTKLNFVPNLNWYGSEELTYNLTAGNETRSGKVQLEYLPVNDPPVFSSINRTIEVSVAANDDGSGNVYVIEDVQKKSLTLEPGSTYTFNHPSEHPLRFSTTPDGTHGGGNSYDNDVDTSTDGVTIIKVTDNTPVNLYYYCSIHEGMGSDSSKTNETSAKFIFEENALSDISLIEATDVDNETLTYYLSGDDKNLITVSTSGLLKFVSSPDYENPLDADKDSIYNFSLNVSDGELSISKEINVPIKDINIAANQVGQTITGNVNSNNNKCLQCFTTNIDIDEDGDTFVIGMEGSFQVSGFGRVYKKINNSWSEMPTNKFTGAAQGNGFGSKGMKISDNGLTIIGGGQQNSIGYVFPFEYYDKGLGAGLEWRRRGDYVDYGNIYKSTIGRNLTDISISGNGNVMGYVYGGKAILHDNNNVIGFTYNSNPIFESFNTNGLDTTAISINFDGSYVALSQRYEDVRIYKFNSGEYLQIGNTLTACSGITGNSFGDAIAISNNGKTIVVSDNNQGATCVFEYINNSWVQKGSTIYGDNLKDYLGSNLDISGDGKRIALASIGANESKGEVKVFEWSNLDNDWKQTGFDIIGEELEQDMGYISLSGDGKTIVITGPGKKQSTTGAPKDGGKIRIYNLPIN